MRLQKYINEGNKSGQIGANSGEVMEGIFAFGIAAKFMKRLKNGDIGDVNTNDIYKIIDNMNNGIIGNFEIEDNPIQKINVKVFDKITLGISLGISELKILFDKELRNSNIIKSLYSNVLTYVNKEKQLEKMAIECNKNAKVDYIIINADGTVNQKNSKADITISVNGEVKRKSLKLISKTIGQKSGIPFSVQQDLFNKGLKLNINGIKELYEMELSKIKNYGDLIFLDRNDKHLNEIIKILTNAVKISYLEATNQLNKKLSNKKSKIDFFKNIIDFIQEHATKGDKFLEIISFDKKGKFKKMSFGKEFEEKMWNIDLVAEMKSTKRPVIEVKDLISGKLLFHIRALLQKPSKKSNQNKIYGYYLRNYIEVGKLMYDIALITD
jgi:hypothetical protein